MTAASQLTRIAAMSLIVALGACTDPSEPRSNTPLAARAATGPKVSSTQPSQSGRDTTLDVQINGSGFDAGSRADWLLAGVSDARVRTNSTRFVSSTSLVANITISSDAVAASYDVMVTTASGKTGIGTESYAVLAMEELSSPAGTSNANDVTSSGLIVGGRGGGCESLMAPAYWQNGGSPMDLPLVAPWCGGSANFVNESGVIIGGLGATRVAVRWVPNIEGGYEASGVTLMGPLPEGSSPDLKGLNASGIVIANHNGSPGSRPYWWSEGVWTGLPIPAGATQCYVEAFNDLGEASGMCTVGGVSSATFWSSLTSAPVLLPRLEAHAGSHSAIALNDNGVAVGYATRVTKSGSLLKTGVRWTRTAGTWSGPEMLPDLGGGGTQTWDINNDGVIVGASWTGTGKNHAFILVPGQPIRDLGGLGSEHWAFAVTPAGSSEIIVVGVSNSSTYKRGTVWRP
jgi:probable HAF family extracellular repeat protein